MTAAKQDRATTLDLLRPVPGIGNILRVVLRSESHDLQRFPRVQDVVSYGRVVTCAKESAGTRDGVAGTTIGQAYLTGAFSEAAVLCLRNHAAGQKWLARLAKQQGQGNALTVLAHQLARAVSSMLKRRTAVDLDTCLPQSWSEAGEPDAELDGARISLATALCSARRP
jgi:transposase